MERLIPTVKTVKLVVDVADLKRQERKKIARTKIEK